MRNSPPDNPGSAQIAQGTRGAPLALTCISAKHRQTGAVTEDDAGSSQLSGGRHRAPKPAQKPLAALWLIVAVVAVVAVLAGSAYLLWDDDVSETPVTDGVDELDTSPESPSDSQASSSVEATRDTKVRGTTVTVRESISLVGGGDVRVAPQSAKPAAGLVWLSSSLINEDGTTPAFDAPLALTEGGNVTIVGTYRLTRCPDLLPTSWPTPVKIVGGDWKRTFTRSQVPLRTARAICPRADSSAKELRGLSGVMLRSRAAVVRLRWEGKSPLVIEVVGAASEVAVLTRSSACKGECVAQIKRNSTARLALRPVDRCAIGGRSNDMTLQVSKSKAPSRAAKQSGSRMVSVSVPGLASKVCTAARQ